MVNRVAATLLQSVLAVLGVFGIVHLISSGISGKCQAVRLSYLDMLKRQLTREGYPRKTIGLGGWPAEAETMLSLERLDNIEFCVREVIRQGVPGDLIECGAWRGGATIFMRAALDYYGDTKDRRVWVADSFQGLPKPDPLVYPADANDPHWTFRELAAPLESVKHNFARYGMLDDRVRFLPGWFKDTLPTAPIQQLAVLRIDADMYEGTIQALEYLYDKVPRGGFCIIDDYGAVEGCRHAVEDFRAKRKISEPMRRIDWTGVFWRKAALP